MMKTLVASAALALASADTFGTFTPSLQVYVSTNGTCFGASPTLAVDGSISGWQGCKAIKGTTPALYVSLPACNLDANSNGPAPCFSTQKDCSVCSDSSNFGFGYCSNPDDFSDTISYVSSCSVEPSGSSTGWVVSLAVILSISTVGLCVFWRVRDLRALAKAKAEALAHAADVEAEAAKNNSVTGITISAGPGAHGASHGGYNAL